MKLKMDSILATILMFVIVVIFFVKKVAQSQLMIGSDDIWIVLRRRHRGLHVFEYTAIIAVNMELFKPRVFRID